MIAPPQGNGIAISGVVSSYPTVIQRAGGSVTVDSAGVIAIAPLATKGITITTTTATLGAIQFYSSVGAQIIAAIYAGGVLKTTINTVVTSNDLIIKSNGGATEAFRIEQSTAFVKIAVRLGINTTPAVTLDVNGDALLRGNTSIINNSANVGQLEITPNGVTKSALWATSVTSSTSPTILIKYGATPGAGGYGLRIYKSDGTTNVFGITDKYSVVIGGAALGTTATDGFLYIPTCAGAPTGVPTAFTGCMPLIYDSTNHFLYFYDSGWKKSTVYA